MTVSRALSSNDNVSAKTRKTVMDYAVQIGYVKSSAATTMRGTPTAIIGLLLPNIINEFYARFANALELLCTDAGFDLVIYLTNDDYPREVQSLRRLDALQARAVIHVPAPRSEQALYTCADETKLISLIRTRDEARCAGSLMLDDGSSIQAAVHHLAEKGYQRIAYIGASESLSSGRRRLASFTEALSEYSRQGIDQFIRTGAPSYTMGLEFMQALLDAPEPPDAVVCGGFEISNGALDACLTREISIPDTLAFVGYGDPTFYRWIAGGITTVTLSEHDVAGCAIELIRELDTHPTGRSARVIPTRLVIRGST